MPARLRYETARYVAAYGTPEQLPEPLSLIHISEPTRP